MAIGVPRCEQLERRPQRLGPRVGNRLVTRPPNKCMQLTALRAAADAERYAAIGFIQ